MDKILFLDIDGVLNSSPDIKTVSSLNISNEEKSMKRYGIDPILANRLRKIIDSTGCKIVFSTGWRTCNDHLYIGNNWRQKLADMMKVSTDIFIGDTPVLYKADFTRGEEILAWLKQNKEKISSDHRICILDDITFDITPVLGEDVVVKTDTSIGLSESDVVSVIKILNEGMSARPDTSELS